MNKMSNRSTLKQLKALYNYYEMFNESNRPMRVAGGEKKSFDKWVNYEKRVRPTVKKLFEQAYEMPPPKALLDTLISLFYKMKLSVNGIEKLKVNEFKKLTSGVNIKFLNKVTQEALLEQQLPSLNRPIPTINIDIEPPKDQVFKERYLRAKKPTKRRPRKRPPKKEKIKELEEEISKLEKELELKGSGSKPNYRRDLRKPLEPKIGYYMYRKKQEERRRKPSLKRKI